MTPLSYVCALSCKYAWKEKYIGNTKIFIMFCQNPLRKNITLAYTLKHGRSESKEKMDNIKFHSLLFMQNLFPGMAYKEAIYLFFFFIFSQLNKHLSCVCVCIYVSKGWKRLFMAWLRSVYGRRSKYTVMCRHSLIYVVIVSLLE